MTLRAIIAAGLVGLAAAAAVGSRPLIFAAAAVILLALAAGYARGHLFDRLEYRRVLSKRVVTWGGEIEVATEVVNRKWLPVVWLHVHDEWPRLVQPLWANARPTASGSLALDQTFSVRWYERVRRRYRGRCMERGVHSFGPAALVAADPFGLAGGELHAAHTDRLLVLPKVLAVPDVELLFGRPLVGATVRRSLAHDPTSLVGVRPYRADDSVRAVNWRATARHGALYSNDWEPTTLAQVLIILDARSFEYPWQGMSTATTELLCVVCASLAGDLQDRGFGVGLVSNARQFSDWRQVEVAPGTGTLPEILEALARVIVFPPPPLDDILAHELALPHPFTEYVVVTASVNALRAPLLAALRAERTTHVVYVEESRRVVVPGSPTSAVPERPTPEQNDVAQLIDARIPAGLDWRGQDALPLA